jgi:hypothetical protein
MLALLEETSTTATAKPSRFAMIVVAALAVAAIAVGATNMLRDGSAGESKVSAGAELIAVTPLGAVSDTALARIGQDLAVTLSANFDGVGSIRSIDAATLLMKARRLPSPLPIADARKLAIELGAGSVMTGTLIHEGGRIRASVVLHQTASDSVLAKATALAAPSDIATLTDSLTWSVLRQVWRRGTAPSPVLTGLTTTSIDALRAFLEGERLFMRLDSKGAMAEYRRAFELDSNFVQAYLRFDYVIEWILGDPDTDVRRRLYELKDRLPERERLWVETRQLALPLPARVARWKSLAARYPDYPPFLMAAADPILHYGPFYGIPLEEARPLLDRLDILVPDHADTKMHQAIIPNIASEPLKSAAAFREAGKFSNGHFGMLLTFSGDLLQARATNANAPDEQQALRIAREMQREGVSGLTLMITGLSSVRVISPEVQLKLLKRVRDANIYSGDAAQSTGFGESALLASRGDFIGGVTAAGKMTSETLPFDMRLTAARLAVVGAWLEAVEPSIADSVVTAAMSWNREDIPDSQRAELFWLDGMVGVLTGNAARYDSARQRLMADSTPVALHTATSLSAFWDYRTNQDRATNSIESLTEEVMREGRYVFPAEALGRLLIVRKLRKQNKPQLAERYLMWGDGALNLPSAISTYAALGPITTYERASALDAAGKQAEARDRYREFLQLFDKPTSKHRDMVETAKARLAALEATDVRQTKPVPPAERK